jgi:hypothetical protein
MNIGILSPKHVRESSDWPHLSAIVNFPPNRDANSRLRARPALQGSRRPGVDDFALVLGDRSQVLHDFGLGGRCA